MTETVSAAYDLRGDLIEACSCFAPCPCWVADFPDGGSCWSFTGYYVRTGTSRGVDVSDRSLISLVQIPGHVDRKSTRLNSSHANISYAVFCLKKKHNTI